MRRRSALVVAGILAELGRQQITLQQLSDRTSIPMSVLNRKLNGESTFDVEELGTIARVLDVPVTALTSTTH